MNRSILSKMRTAALFALVASTVCQGQVDVIYTGRTLGYLRVPDQQDLDMQTCITDIHDPKVKDPAKTFLDSLTVRRNANSLTVGMGDNFGPELFARTLRGFPSVATPHATGLRASANYMLAEHHVPYPGKDLFFWDPMNKKWVLDATDGGLVASLKHHQGKIPADNVGCFIRLAGYDAIVPGKHDFEAGPEHLINMAKFLVDDDVKLPKTVILGANMAIVTAVPNAKPKLPLYQVEHDFELQRRAKGLPANYNFSIVFPSIPDVPTPSLKVPDVIFPWLNEIAINNAFCMFPSPGPGSTTCDTGTPLLAANLLGKWSLLSGPTHTEPPGQKFRIREAEANQAALHLEQARPPSGALLFKAPPPPVSVIPVTVRSRIGKVLLCVGTETDPYGFFQDGQAKCLPDALEDKPADPDSYASGQIKFKLPPLMPNINYGVCIEIPAGGKFHCQPFYVSTPFFSADKAQPVKPFAIKTTSVGSVAVFGVVDPDLQSKIGRLNFGWWNSNTDYETTVQIADPAASLKQAMMSCDADADCKKANRKVLLAQMPAAKATQLLNNIDTVFDLVVAQTDMANKTENVTVNRAIAQSRKKSAGGATWEYSTGANFVVTPDELFSPGPDKFHYRIPKATVRKTPLSDISQDVVWTLNNSIPDKDSFFPIPPPDSGPLTLRMAAAAALQKMGADVNANWSDADVLQRLALLAMQRELHADVSAIQSRDIFEPQIYGQAEANNHSLQELLDRVLWKNDYAVRIPVTGATLTSILTASAAFAAQDANPLNTDLEKGQDLVTLGVFKEAAEQNWAVNGGLLDPARLYSVALTDFLAVGDTGYTALQTPAVPFPYRIRDFPSLVSISGLVCQQIAKSVDSLKNAPCSADPLKAEDYLDPSDDQPSDARKGFTVTRQTEGYLSIPLRLKRFDLFYKGQNKAETESSQKPFWSLSVEKNDFGLNVDLHKKFTASGAIQTMGLTNEFSGVQIAAVTAPNSYAIMFDNRMRLKRSQRSFDFYILDDMSLSYARTQDSPDNNFTRNLSTNTLSLESGGLIHIYPWLKRQTLRETDLLIAVRGDSQVLSPREDAPIPAQTCLPNSASATNCAPALMPCAAGSTSNCLGTGGMLRGTLRRSLDLYGKAGIRFSDSRSWLEFGYLGGQSLQVPYSVLLMNGLTSPNNTIYLTPGLSTSGNCTSASSPCVAPPLPGQPLFSPFSHPAGAQDWINYLSYYGYITPSTQLKGVYKTRPLDGLFFNFSLNTPLPVFDHYASLAGGPGIAFLAENTGRILFNRKDDLTAQTRYQDKLALSLVIPVLGNFSLKPEVDLFYYRNKVADLPFHSVDYLVTFSYTFDWRQGQAWWRAVRFPTPAPTSSVPTSGR